MTPTRIVNHLSTQQRQCLIDHSPGPQPFHAVSDADTNGLRQTKQCLIGMKLLSPTGNRFGNHLNPRPPELALTDTGKEVVCIILARMADALVAAGCLDALTSQKVFAAITEKSQRMRPRCTKRDTIYHAVATPAEGHAQSICRDRNATEKLLSLLAGG